MKHCQDNTLLRALFFFFVGQPVTVKPPSRLYESAKAPQSRLAEAQSWLASFDYCQRGFRSMQGMCLPGGWPRCCDRPL